jgi:phage major head subunit gpT-like protein
MPYHPSLSSRAIIGTFYRRLQEAYDAGWARRIAWHNPDSNQEAETYNWLGQAPVMREWGTGRLIRELLTKGLTISNIVYEATERFGIDDMRRDKTGQIDVRIKEMAKRAAEHWDKLLTALIVGGASALCYDGDYFFGTAHSEGSSGTQANILTSSEVSTLDVGTATAPTQAEMAKAILGVIGYMLTYKDDQGEPINGDARNFLVMVAHPQIYAPAMAACSQVQLEAGSGAVQPNVLTATPFKVDCVLNARIAATSYTDDFWLFRTDGDVKGFITQEEQELKMDAIAEGSELEINTRQHQYGVTAVRGAGYGMWQHAAFATLS